MAITVKWQGHSTSTTARLVVRSDANGVLTATCDGQTFTGSTISTASNDGIGIVDISGLLPGTSYAYTVSVGGSSASGTLKTMPTTAPFKVGFMSCMTKLKTVDALVQSLIEEGVAAVVHQGDYIYCSENVSSWWNETSAVPTTGSAASVYMAHFRQVHRQSHIRLLDAYCPQYFQGDDHEVGGDNWDHSVTQAQVSPNVASGGTQAEVDASWWAANQAMIAYYQGNPTNNDAGIHASTDKPANAAGGTPAAQYPPKYFRFMIGNAEFFVLDTMSYRSILTATDNASKTMLGATQKQWLKDRLSASTATFKIICSPKMTLQQTSVSDGWDIYSTERTELLTYCRDNVSSKGVFWVCGDNHAPTVSRDAVLEHSAICANPAGVDHLSQSSGYSSGVVYKYTGQAGGTPTRSVEVAGLLEFYDDELVVRIIDPLGRNLYRGVMPAGSNLLSQSGKSISVS
jgi:phosphodiesterase/alkaline phosphatase D-like protein